MQSVDNAVINYAAQNFHFLSAVLGTDVKNFILIQWLLLLLFSVESARPSSPHVSFWFLVLFFHRSV